MALSYWTPSWFAPSWFAPTYWANAGAVPPDDLLGAIVARLVADPTIAAACGSGDAARVWKNLAPPRGMVVAGVMAPGIVVTKVWSNTDYTLTDNVIRTTLAQVSLHVPNDPDLAESLNVRIAAVFSPARGYAPLVFADGKEIVRLPGRITEGPETGLGPGGVYVQQTIHEITFLTAHTLSLP